MKNADERKDRNFCVRISYEDYKMMEYLIYATKESKSDIVRKLVKDYYEAIKRRKGDI